MLKALLFAVRCMCCSCKLDGLLLKCVRCSNAYITFYAVCDTKILITVTQEGTSIVKHGGRSYIQATRTCQIHTSMMICAKVGRGF